jgi:hypothetical protein
MGDDAGSSPGRIIQVRLSLTRRRDALISIMFAARRFAKIPFFAPQQSQGCAQ